MKDHGYKDYVHEAALSVDGHNYNLIFKYKAACDIRCIYM